MADQDFNSTGKTHDGLPIFYHKETGELAVLKGGYFCNLYGYKKGVWHWYVKDNKNLIHANKVIKGIANGASNPNIANDPQFHADLKAWYNAVTNNGKQYTSLFVISSGHRGWGRMGRWSEGNKKGRSSGELASDKIFVRAPEGFSQHHSGYAIDVTVNNDTYTKNPGFNAAMETEGAKYGFVRPFKTSPTSKFGKLKQELWHWVYTKGKARELLFNTI